MTDSVQLSLAALAELVDQLDNAPPPDPTRAADSRWAELEGQLGGALTGRRALVLGGDAVGDADELAVRGAEYVLSCAAAGGSSGHPQVDFQPLSWEQLDPERQGRFELVLCQELIHRVTDPVGLLRMLRKLTTDGGTLLLGAAMIDDPERSEYLRFVPDRYAGDSSWWMIPGRLAIRWMLQTAGFAVEAEFAEREGPRELFPIVEAYLRAVAQ